MLYPLRRNVGVAVVMLAVVTMGVVAGCDTSGPSPNTSPNTILTNVPPAGDTLAAVQTLHWDGTDEDGFVPGYEYRYRSVYFRSDGSVDSTGWKPEGEDGWRQTDQTSLRIAFDSQGEVNKQIFQVRALDNEGMTSEVDEKVFYTSRSLAPVAEVGAPSGGSQRLATPDGETTDWWQGVRLTYTASDPNEDGEVVEYAWAADDGPWHWTEDTTVVVGPQAFSQPIGGEHTLRVRARDNTDLVSEPVTARFELIQPSFENDVLIVDETNESAVPFRSDSLNATDADVDQFYADAFGVPDETDWWDYQQRGAPSREKLAQYGLVLWHGDNEFNDTNNAHNLPQHTDLLAEYMDVGGDLIMSGWQMLASFAPQEFGAIDQVNHTFPDTSFVRTYLHIREARQPALPSFQGADFRGARGTGAFRKVLVDSTKLDGISPYDANPARPNVYGYPIQINTISEPAGFTEATYRYLSRTGKADFEGQPVGLRYRGTTFDAIVFGFPIYFLRKDDAQALGEDVLQSMGYR